MASFADQNSSFVSGRSSRSGTRKPKTKRLEPYVSPFVLEANKRAQQRVKERLSRARPPRIPSPPPVFQHDSGEWNKSVQSAGLFDPALRKQEIFRLEPRNRRNNNESQRPQAQNSSNVTRSDSTTTTSNNMTVRTNRDSPVRNINRAPYRNSERSQSPNENSWQQQQQQANDEVHRPKPSNNDIAPQTRSTRSTSPIDERIMRDIYSADENAPDASSFTMRRQHQQQSSSGRPPAFQAAEFQQFLREHGRPREPMDPQALRGHYGNMIRDRLRQLLQQHREGKGDANDNAAEPPVKPYPYFSKLRRQGSGSGVMGGYFRPADVVDTQLMTRDLMASMAQIMTAVGEIVTNQQQTQHRRRRSRKDWYKEHPLPTTSAAAAPASQRTFGAPQPNAAPSAPTVISSARVKSNNGAVPATPMALSELAALSAAKGIAKLREKEASKEARKAKDPQRKEFMWDMAQALQPETILRDAVVAAGQGAIDPADIPLPKNKAAVFDMIFTKLQSIEQCEHDLISFLQAPREHPTDLPVDPILQDLKLRKEKKKGSVSTASPQVPLVPNAEDIPPPPRTTPVEQAKSAANSTFDFLKRYPPLGTISSCIRSDFEAYKLKLDKARKLRDAPFLKKNSDVAIAADTVADAICDRIIGAVATEIGGFVEDYSKNYVGKL